jgi:hypothetical protein
MLATPFASATVRIELVNRVLPSHDLIFEPDPAVRSISEIGPPFPSAVASVAVLDLLHAELFPDAAMPDRKGTGAKRYAHHLPDGQITQSLSSPFCKNILIFRRPKSGLYLSPSCPTQRGVSRTSRDVGAGCGGRSGARTTLPAYGRRRRVVLTPRCWCQVGGQPLTTVARKPVAGESTV